ncbi:MAG: type VI secretion system accessory protein TagJ [Planctomycetota bacterium]
MTAKEALKAGDLQAALAQLTEETRSQPDDPKHRVFLFQLLAVRGEWDRSLTQLNVVRDLDESARLMAQTYQECLRCEVLRREVFAGKRTPLVFGDPTPWLAQLIEAIRLDSQGETAAAADLRGEAFEAAPAVPGTLSVAAGDGEQEHRFDWIADGDSRLGPVLEIIVNGRYYWAPAERVAEITFEPPADLRDVVWTPAHFRWANEGEAAGIIPTRYVDSEKHADDAVRLSRKTEWEEVADGAYHGLGQRVLLTDAGDFALMDLRRVTLSGATDAG